MTCQEEKEEKNEEKKIKSNAHTSYDLISATKWIFSRTADVMYLSLLQNMTNERTSNSMHNSFIQRSNALPPSLIPASNALSFSLST